MSKIHVSRFTTFSKKLSRLYRKQYTRTLLCADCKRILYDVPVQKRGVYAQYTQHQERRLPEISYYGMVYLYMSQSYSIVTYIIRLSRIILFYVIKYILMQSDPETLHLTHDYEAFLKDAKPTRLNAITVHPPKGALGSTRTLPEQTIPPINTNISFSLHSAPFVVTQRGLSALSQKTLPTSFNWRNGSSDPDIPDTEIIRRKIALISKPGNQMLCGSCWAISGAGIIADNFVVSGIVDWVPNLSTTWSLTCYPQMQCQGGNPAKLFQDVAHGGITSNHCIDYSWCSENKQCNGNAKKHFDASNLSSLIPDKCGCYSDSNHYLYNISKDVRSINLNQPDMTIERLRAMIKHTIYTKGPVMGGFLVFKNFMHGSFTHVNGGIYLEDGVYDSGAVHFDPLQTTYYTGSHAVAIIGWGTEKNVVVDNEGTKKDVPYWYCRNSWTEKWGDGGYFKMAMYPYNKMAQFDKMVVLNSQGRSIGSGGMVIISAEDKPVKKSFNSVKTEYPLSKPDAFYKTEPEPRPQPQIKNENNSFWNKKVLGVQYKIVALIVVVVVLIILILSYKKSK